MTILFYSNRPSNGLNNLKDAIEAAMPRGALKLRASGSTRNVRAQDLLVNWGCSQVDIPAANLRSVVDERYLNKPAAVAVAADKKKTLMRLRNSQIPTVEWTVDANAAQAWLDSGSIVYSRTRLSGHSGEGIVLSFNNPAGVGDAGNAFVVRDTLPTAPLYTKAVMGQRREWRVHVMKGQVIHIQQKKRANGYESNPDYSNLVRNHHTGWIYATSDIQLPAGVADIAVRTIAALGLDFGAVDIITRQGSTYVLEVNTACGQEAGQTLGAYTAALLAIHNDTAIPAAVIVQGDSNVTEAEAQPAVAQSRSREELLAEFNEAKRVIVAYLNATSHLSASGGWCRTAFLQRVDVFSGEFLESPSEGTLSVVKNKFNKLKAAAQRFGELSEVLEQSYNELNIPERSELNRGQPFSYLRSLLGTMVKDTAAEVSASWQNANLTFNTRVAEVRRDIAARRPVLREPSIAAAAPAPAAAAPANPNQLGLEQALEVSQSFSDWLAGQVRTTGRPSSQIIAVLRQDFML